MQRCAQSVVKDLERHPYVFLPGEHHKRRLIFLSRTTRPLLRRSNDEHDCSQIVFRRLVADLQRRRKEGCVRIAGFVSVPWSRGSHVRRHALSQHIYPLAVHIVVAVTREPEVPERSVDAHGPRSRPWAWSARFAAWPLVLRPG